MYLYVFIYSVEGVGPRNVRPIKTLILSILIDFPTCLSTYCMYFILFVCLFLFLILKHLPNFHVHRNPILHSFMHLFILSFFLSKTPENNVEDDKACSQKSTMSRRTINISHLIPQDMCDLITI